MNSLWPFFMGAVAGVLGVFFFHRSRDQRSDLNESITSFRLSSGPYVVAVGGGTGLSSLLSGLKGFTRNITAVVTVTDEGGSSGRLSRDWGVLPPGDIRNCLVALSENDDSLRQIMDFRFDKGDIAGHSLGNLMLLAATEISGDFKLAVERMNQLLAMRGRVIPVSTENIVLAGKNCEGKSLRGELQISSEGSCLSDIWIEPFDAAPVRDVISAVETSDLIVLGPGSLFTSVIPNLLISEFSKKIIDSSIPVVYVANLMTQPEETEGMSISDHILWIEKIMGKIPDFIIVNDQEIPENLKKRYKSDGAVPLYLNTEEETSLIQKGCQPIRGFVLKIVNLNGELVIRHDGHRLSEILMSLIHQNSEVI